MYRRPPRSTLFPYRPLSRSHSTAAAHRFQPRCEPAPARRGTPLAWKLLPPYLDPTRNPKAARSEEHTSELQSRQYLVCRLLLEKKKNNPKVQLCRRLFLPTT